MHSDISIEEDVNDLNQKVGKKCPVISPWNLVRDLFSVSLVDFFPWENDERVDGYQSDKKDAFFVIWEAYLSLMGGKIASSEFCLSHFKRFFSPVKMGKETQTKTAFIFISARNHSQVADPQIFPCFMLQELCFPCRFEKQFRHIFLRC